MLQFFSYLKRRVSIILFVPEKIHQAKPEPKIAI
jgi:hypothetical protein